ncbi:MAG: Cpe/LpqF family protein [Thermomicrobiales bacterium]
MPVRRPGLLAPGRTIVAPLALAVLVALGTVVASIQGSLAQEPTPTFVANSLATAQFTWLLDRINSGAGDLSEDEVQDHFTERFVEAVGPAVVVSQIQTIAATYAPLMVATTIQQTDDLMHVQAQAKDGTLVVIAVSIEHSDGKIAGFIVQPGDADLPFVSGAASPASSPGASPAASPAASPKAD